MPIFEDDYEHNSDPLDLSAAQQERLLRAKLAERKPVGPKPTGFCLDPNCGEQLVSDELLAKIREGHPAPEGTRRWCSAECREAWERSR